MNIPSLAPVLRIVPDTNFLISAFLFPGSQPARALAIAQRTGKILCSKETLTELTGVLFRPKFDRNSSIEARIRTLLDFRKTVEVVTVQTIIAECRHPKDDKFLALALDGEAHLLLTGDSDLLTLNPWRGVQILRPGAFVEAMTQPADRYPLNNPLTVPPKSHAPKLLLTMASAATLADPKVSTPSLSFEEKLDRFAHLAVRVGLNLQPGQDLLISATTDMLPLVRRITEHAYKAGAPLVTTLYSDDESILARFRHAPADSFDRANQWLADGIFNAFSTGTTRLSLTGGNPALLAQQDPALVSRANIAASIANKPALNLITRHTINWSVMAAATPAWAALVFPGLPADQALAKLWDAIFTASRSTGDDPVADWKAHSAHIHERVEYLNRKRFHSLRFFSDDKTTDLVVGLADDHLWAGGGAKSGNGIFSNANIPTEECFTTPHKDRIDGHVRASKPLSYQGTLIENITCLFEAGRITKATASAGEDVLNRLISTDEGARSLGEVALVPHSSPIAQSGILFWNTLFDENAASHIALGQAYATCLIDGEHMDEDALAAKGANRSLIHVDWMIGSGQMNVDGLTHGADGKAGTSEPLMRAGEWV